MPDEEQKIVAGPFDVTTLTPGGWLVLTADARVQGTHLVLENLAIDPIHTKAIPAFTASLFALRSKILQLASAQGYTELTIEGIRRSGASPNRPFLYHWRLR